jgi:hypothetical protein
MIKLQASTPDQSIDILKPIDKNDTRFDMLMRVCETMSDTSKARFFWSALDTDKKKSVTDPNYAIVDYLRSYVNVIFHTNAYQAKLNTSYQADD